MRKIFSIFCGFMIVCCSFPIADCRADVKYLVAKNGGPDDTSADIGESVKRVYIYGGYNFHFANDVHGLKTADSNGGLTGGFGFRFTDNVRAELSYDYMRDDYGFAAATGHFGFANFIFDAKLPPEYRIFKTSPFVPFVGFGAGGGRYSMAGLPREISWAYNFIGGVSLEINRTLAVAFAYRFVKILAGDLAAGAISIQDCEPPSHNVNATLRINF